MWNDDYTCIRCGNLVHGDTDPLDEDFLYCDDCYLTSQDDEIDFDFILDDIETGGEG